MHLRLRNLPIVGVLLTAPLALYAGGAPAHENFDIRLSTEKADVRFVADRSANPAAPASFAATVSARMLSEREALAQALPGLHLLEATETGAPEVVGVARGKAKLSAPSIAPTESIARQWVNSHSWLYGLSPAQAAALELDADYANPAGNLSWVRLVQRLHGLPVFRGEITIALTCDGEVARTTGQLAAGLPDEWTPASARLTAAEAVAAAAATVGRTVDPDGLVSKSEAVDGSSVIFERGLFDAEIRAELVYFPLGRGAVELAWSTTLWGNPDVYTTLVSADDGALLWRKNLTEYESFTYHVYDADSPAPLSPSTADPDNHFQAPGIARTPVVVESEVSTNDPWLEGDAAETAGNNVIAGIDRDGVNGVDAGGTAPTTSLRTFNHVFSPPPSGAEDPLGAAYQDGAVTTLFFWVNRYHDRLYDLGFTEAARNFQNDNFGRGGVGSDRVSAEAQDSSGTNNANFSTPADGGSGRMQMFLFPGPTPDRDGGLDQEIVLHELTHGTSNRLHGNSAGLASNMSRGMGEGWSDFYALSVLSEPGDDPDGNYAVGGYATYLLDPDFTDNYYYGIRRFPRAPITRTGGPFNRPFNPQTFADIDATQKDLSDGAWPVPVEDWLSTTADQVHAAGEVWSSALWEARSHVIGSLGTAAGNQRMLQLTTDGMKLDPVNPTFIDARDSILAADCAGYGGASEADLWAGFAARGMGYGAEVLAAGSGSGTARVVESFAGGNAVFGAISMTNRSCSEPDRAPIPGEIVEYSVELVSPFCATDLTGVSASIAGGTAADYGTIPPGGNATRPLLFQIPSGTACNEVVAVEIGLSSNLGAAGTSLELQVGPHPIDTTEFTNPAAISIPGAEGQSSGPGDPYPSEIVVSGIIGPILGVTVRLNGFSHSWASDVDMLLVSPSGEKMIFMSDAFGNTEPTVVDLTLADGAAEPLPSSAAIATGSYQPVNYGAGDLFDGPAPAGPYLDPPFSNFAGATANGTWSLYIDDDFSGDTGSILNGWTLGILTAGEAVCAPCATPGIFADGFESGDTSRWWQTVD